MCIHCVAQYILNSQSKFRLHGRHRIKSSVGWSPSDVEHVKVSCIDSTVVPTITTSPFTVGFGSILRFCPLTENLRGIPLIILCVLPSCVSGFTAPAMLWRRLSYASRPTPQAERHRQRNPRLLVTYGSDSMNLRFQVSNRVFISLDICGLLIAHSLFLSCVPPRISYYFILLTIS